MSIFGNVFRAINLVTGVACVGLLIACGGDPENTPEAATPTFKIGAAIGVIEGGHVSIDAKSESCRNIGNMTIEVLANNSTVSPDPASARSYAQSVIFTITDSFGNSRSYSVEVSVRNCSQSAAATSTSKPISGTPNPPTEPGPPPEPADKYAGQWDSGCQTDGESSGTMRATFVKTGSNSYSGTLEGSTYNTTNCSGPVNDGDTLTNMGVNIVGTKIVDGRTVDKMMVTSSEALAKAVAFCDGEELQLGVDQNDLDGEGFPNSLFHIILRKI